jgi:uncharacterized CHY-type Zn-finger protein
MQLQQVKSELFNILKHIKDNHNPQQPWLNPTPSFKRPNSEAQQSGHRADQNGTQRNLKLSDVGSVVECEKVFASSLLSVNLHLSHSNVVYRGKGGTMLHQELERLMPLDIVTPLRNKAESFVRLPSIGPYTDKEYTGKFYSGINGQYDSYATKWNTGIEFKSVPDGHVLPDTVPDRTIIQGALYAYGLKLKGVDVKRWSWLYLPLDLDKLDINSLDTYKVFFKSYEELEPLALNALKQAERVSQICEIVGGDFKQAESFLKCYNIETCSYCKLPW